MNSFVDTYALRTIPGRFSTNYHVLFQMQTKNFKFRTKIMAGQIRKNGNLSLRVWLSIFFFDFFNFLFLMFFKRSNKRRDMQNKIVKRLPS